MSEPGKPQLPHKTILLGVPAEATVELQIVSDEVVPVPGRYAISPAPQAAPITEETLQGKELYIPDAAAYASAALYPAHIARLTDDAWLRDQRIVQVELSPFQYNAAQGTLLWHRRLRVEAHFVNSPGLTGDHREPASDSPFEPALRANLLNYQEARAWRGAPQDAARQSTLISPDPTPRYKLVVDHDGIYRVRYEDLQGLGPDLTTIDPHTFRLTSQGQGVAIYVEGEDSGHFGPGDSILFYGQKFRGDYLASQYAGEDAHWPTLGNYGWQPHFNSIMLEKYTDENVYWLYVGGTPGPRMAAVSGIPTGTAPTRTFYPATVHTQQKNMTYIQNYTSEDIWFWDQVNTTDADTSVTHTYTTTLTAVASEPFSATILAEMWAKNYTTGPGPDHRTRLLLNDPPTLVADATWTGPTRYQEQGQVDQSALLEGVNTLSFNVIQQTVFEAMYFNWFDITYARRFVAQNDQLFFSGVPSGTWQYTITNLLTPTLMILDVTNPLSLTRVLTPTATPGNDVFMATFEATHGSAEQF